MVTVATQDHDGSLPGPPQRPTIIDAEHDAVATFRDTVKRAQSALARVVDVHHIDDDIAAQLMLITEHVGDLHDALDVEHAAWLETAEADRQAEIARILAAREVEATRRAALTPAQREAEDAERAAAAKAKRVAELTSELETLTGEG
jgi:hypothetical protein